MEIQGKVKALLPEQKGTSARTGNTWKSQDFVLDYFWWPNQVFASQMVLKMFGADRIAQWDLHVNDEVKIRYHIEAHEYNGRWFNEIRCDGIEKIGASAVASAQPQSAEQAAGTQPVEVSGLPDIYSKQTTDEKKDDDLPF